MTAEDIESFLDWQPTETRGKHTFRLAAAPPEFTRFYNLNSDQFKAAGVHWFGSSVGENSFAWFSGGPHAPVARAEPTVAQDEPGACSCPGECQRKPHEARRLNLDMAVVGQLRCYQLPGVRTLADAIASTGIGLNTSRLGSGKTYTACAVARMLNRKLLVIAPKATLPTWRRVAQFMGADLLEALNYEKLRTGKTIWGEWVKQPKKRTEEWLWKLPADLLVIYDEVHNCSGLKSKNAEILVNAVDAKLPILMMSGTLASEPLKMRALGYALGFHKLYNFDDWLKNHGYHEGLFGWDWKCGMSNGELFTRGFERDKITGASKPIWLPIPAGTAELDRRKGKITLGLRDLVLSKGQMVSLRTEDIPNFPPCDYLNEEVDFSDGGAIDRAYAEMAAELNTLDRLEESAKKKGSKLVIQLRARQKVELIKVPVLADMAKDAVEDGLSVVLFVNFTESARKLAERLKTNCLVIGDQSESEREANVTAFQSDVERVIIVTEQSGGAGLNLQDVTGRFPRLALVAPGFWAEIMRQAGGRVHRDGCKSKTNTTVKAVFAAGTVEEKCMSVAEGKLARVDTFNDGLKL